MRKQLYIVFNNDRAIEVYNDKDKAEEVAASKQKEADDRKMTMTFFRVEPVDHVEG